MWIDAANKKNLNRNKIKYQTTINKQKQSIEYSKVRTPRYGAKSEKHQTRHTCPQSTLPTNYQYSQIEDIFDSYKLWKVIAI